MIKSHTDIEQSKKLAEFLTLESADMWISIVDDESFVCLERHYEYEQIPCWSLAALLDVLSEIKPQVYTPILFPSEGKWILQFAEYGHGNVCEVTCDNPVDACYEMILKLHELNLV